MSEYQYYEWQALDRPLTAAERAEVNKLSSHIEASATHAWVEYNWGDFRHDPIGVLVHYFDAFLYYANWGNQTLAFRFPTSALDEDRLLLYVWEDRIDLQRHGDYFVLTFYFSGEDGEEWSDATPSLSDLAVLRNDILRGDYRSLYVAWLRAAELGSRYDDYESDEPDDDLEPDSIDDLEPPVPSGLNELSTPLLGFMQFFSIDQFLVAAGAARSGPLQPKPEASLRDIERLTREECNQFLLRLAHDEPLLSQAFNRRLDEFSGRPSNHSTTTGRTFSELKEQAQELAKREARRQQAEAEAKRVKALQALAPQSEAIWREVQMQIEQKHASAYDRAVALLVNLRDLAAFQNNMPAFLTRLDELCARYHNRPAFRQRLQEKKLI